jgi:hypothetical protein
VPAASEGLSRERRPELAIDTSLLFGLFLIAGGFALGAAAVYLLYPRRASDDAGAPSKEEPSAEESAPVPPLATAETAEALPSEAVPPPPARAPTEPAPPPGELSMTEQPPSTPPTPDRRLFPVVTLMRDEVTGELALQVGPRLYTEAKALRDSTDWNRVEFAARDLALWLEGSTPPPARRAEERRTEEAPKPSGSMIEQINQVLEAKLASQPAANRGVRLAEGPGGSVRVYVGTQPYALDEVPDPAIREAIREAVSEWEARR